MSIHVYNSLTNRKEAFETVRPHHVGIYLCGPTVYKPSHIGHAVGPIIFDAIKRYLTYRGYKVTWIVNITDVEDKLIVEAASRGMTVPQLAEEVGRNYVEAMQGLGVDGIDHMPKASEHIQEIIDMTRQLIERGAAYVSDGDVYFDVTADDDYGKLSNRRPEDQAGHRELASGAKRHPGDFALWKAGKPDEPSAVKWDSPWGPGRPGWHIECSAMAMKFLGETFDIHGGGLDLIFPHHENEIAQSETCTQRPFARYWLHHGLTRFNTKKVSKSDPEMQAALARMTLSNLLAEHSGELLRFFVLSTHYRRPIEFSTEELAAKKKGLTTFYRLFERIERIAGQSVYGESTPIEIVRPEHASRATAELFEKVADGRDRFVAAMDDDFNTAAAIAVLFDLAGAINRYIEEGRLEDGGGAEGIESAVAAGRVLAGLGGLLGLFRAPPKSEGPSDDLTGKLIGLHIEVRKACREAKMFDLSDLVRSRLDAAGVHLEDRSGGTDWRMDATSNDSRVAKLVDLAVEIRRALREAKQFETADQVREGLQRLGVVLEDKPAGTVWRVEK